MLFQDLNVISVGFTTQAFVHELCHPLHFVSHFSMLFNICHNIFEHMHIYNVQTKHTAKHQSIQRWFVSFSIPFFHSHSYVAVIFFKCSFSHFNMLIVSIKADNMVLNKGVRSVYRYTICWETEWDALYALS